MAKTIKWFNLREFIDYLHEKNPRLCDEMLDFVSSAVAEEQGKFLDPEEGDWITNISPSDYAKDMGIDLKSSSSRRAPGSMGVNMTDIDPHPDITEG